MKKKIERFFTMKRKADDGFTLVELIVVIAILGILAGVGTVGYSGYIKKANEAADQVLLDALNTAFAAACIENGEDNTAVSAGAISIGADKIVDAADIRVSNPSAKAAAIQTAFGKYYQGGEFKVYTALVYSNGRFVNADGGAVAGGVYASLMQTIKENYGSQIEDLKDSTFGSTMGMEALMVQMDQVTQIAAGMTDMEAVQAIFGSEDFAISAMKALGMGADGDALELQDKLEVLKGEMMTNNGGMTDKQAEDRIYANAAVLYTAQLTANMSQEDATKLFEDATRKSILEKMSAGDGEGLAQAALVCGMYTAYSKQSGTTVPSEVNVQNVLNALENDDGFNNYLQGEQGKKDLNGYLSSLQILNSATQGGNVTEVEKLMVNGFADQDLITGLSGLISG